MCFAADILPLSTPVLVPPRRAGSTSHLPFHSMPFHSISNAPDRRAGSTSCITV